MTDRYVRSTDGNDADDGLTWANAKATVAGALVGIVAGDRIFVSQSHSEAPSAAITWTGLVSGVDVLILVVDDTGSPEPPTESDIITTPTVTIDTGTNTAQGIQIVGNLVVTGFIFKTFSSISINFNLSASRMRMEYCTFWLAATTTAKSISIGISSGSSGNVVYWRDCVVKHSHAGNIITNAGVNRGRLFWTGGSLDTSVAVPINLINASVHADLVGVDLSGLSTGILRSGTQETEIKVIGCKMHPSFNVDADLNVGQQLTLQSCGTADQYFQSALSNVLGLGETDTGVYLNATYDGINGISHNIQCRTGSGNKPFCYPLATLDRVDFSSSKTFTVEFARDGSATPYQDDELWIEVEYNDITDNALRRTDASSRCGLLETPANLTTSSAAWTGLSATNNKMKVSTPISSAVAASGPVRIFVCFGDSTAHTDLYADPAITVS